MESIWDIITLNTGNMDWKRLFHKHINVFSFSPDLTEEEKKNIYTDDVVENMRIIGEIVASHAEALHNVLCTKELPAWAVMDVCCNMLSQYPQFTDITYNDSSLRSHGMLIKNGSSETLLKNGVVYDILEPNLYCVLLLEAKGQRRSNEESYSLEYIAENCKLKAQYSRMSRALSTNDFPDLLRELFAVEKNQGKPYQIYTPYWYLCAAVLDRIGLSPFGSNGKTAYSYIENMKFYDACRKEIIEYNFKKKKGVLDSIADFYLFERLFRLNAKFQLFWSEYQSGADESVLSPALLGDFFYSSPLVLFPDGLLSSIFYKPMGGDPKLLYMHGVQTLHFLIQLSSYWFPIVLYILRQYMGIHDIKTADKVKNFFFKDSNLFSLGADSIPECQLVSSEIKRNRTLKEDYANKWRPFSPDKGHYRNSLMPLTLEEWCDKGPSETYTLQDKLALKYIQESLS